LTAPPNKPPNNHREPSMTATPTANLAEYTVSEISTALKRTIEGAYERVRVRGEISGFKRAASGHVYLALKDEKAVLDGVMWRGTASGLRFKPEDGLEVICEGRLTTYAARSRYQLVIETMSPAGVGALLALLEERRKKLSAEGLFDDDRKKPLPFLPEVIGVVTSPTGAVIRDILHRLRERFPRHVLLWPVLVQGEAAAEQIAAAIRGFNKLTPGGAVPRPDLLIVARGGGSIEDLWAFNEEAVVRAAAESTIPLISAVGHETDTTLIDFAADRRAPTPSAAAEIAVPVRADLMVAVAERQRQLIAAMARMLDRNRRHLDGLARGLPRPQALLDEAAQRLDDRAENLRRMIGVYVERRRARLAEAGLKLKDPDRQLAEAGARLAVAVGGLRAAGAARLAEFRHALDRPTRDARLRRAVNHVTAAQARRLAGAGKLLESYSYQRVLERGYAVVRDRAGAVVKLAANTTRGMAASVQFADATVAAVLGGGAAPTLAPTPKKRKRAPDGDQGSLL
jgi:exodeoxyribonuclease VII large subunit